MHAGLSEQEQLQRQSPQLILNDSLDKNHHIQTLPTNNYSFKTMKKTYHCPYCCHNHIAVPPLSSLPPTN